MNTTQQVDIVVRSDHNWQSTDEDESNRSLPKSKRRAKATRASRKALRTDDRPLCFARAVRKRIAGAAFTCEEFYPQSGPQSVLYVVLERGAAQWRDRLRALHTDYFGPEESNTSAPVQLEVIDRTTHEAVERLIAAGLLARTTRFARSLWPMDDSTNCPVPLTETEREKAAQYRRRAARKLKVARALAAAELDQEAQQAVMDAIEPLGCALAVENRWPEPQSLEDALLPPHGVAWKDALPLVRSFMREPSQSLTPILSALAQV